MGGVILCAFGKNHSLRNTGTVKMCIHLKLKRIKKYNWCKYTGYQRNQRGKGGHADRGITIIMSFVGRSPFITSIIL